MTARKSKPTPAFTVRATYRGPNVKRRPGELHFTSVLAWLDALERRVWARKDVSANDR